jgi:hypothetical protein
MTEQRHNFTTSVLWVTALYYLACGVSAITYPKIWLIVSGLPSEVSNELALAFGVAGVYLLTMAAAATLSALNPLTHRSLIFILIVGNLIDFAVTLKAVVAHSLPIINGGLFIAVTVAFAVFLSMAYVKTRLNNT